MVKEVVVLDLNGLLVDRIKNGRNQTIYVRPNAKKFIQDLYELDLLIVIWSSATRRNINKMLSKIFGKDNLESIYLILDQSDCITIESGKPKPLFLKSEEYLKRIIPFPVEILFVDDTEEKMVLNTNTIITTPWPNKKESLKDIFDKIKEWKDANLLSNLHFG